MKCLVTGGVGFIGSQLCNELIQTHDVTVVDNFSSYYDPKLKESNSAELKDSGIKIVKEDILNYQKIKPIMKGIDIVFHLAAQPGVRYSLEHPLEVQKINVEGSNQ